MKRLIPVFLVLVVFGFGLTGCKNPVNFEDGSGGGRAVARDAIVWNGDVDKEIAVQIDGVASTRTNASGAKITSNAHNVDFPGIYFIWDYKQEDSGYLKVSAEVFDKYDSFSLTLKEASKYWVFNIRLLKGQQKTADRCYVFFIPQVSGNKNINMVFVEGFVPTTVRKDLIYLEGDWHFMQYRTYLTQWQTSQIITSQDLDGALLPDREKFESWPTVPVPYPASDTNGLMYNGASPGEPEPHFYRWAEAWFCRTFDLPAGFTSDNSVTLLAGATHEYKSVHKCKAPNESR